MSFNLLTKNPFQPYLWIIVDREANCYFCSELTAITAAATDVIVDVCRVSCVVACQNLCVQNPKKNEKNKQILLTEFTRLNQTIFKKEPPHRELQLCRRLGQQKRH